ncbi:uncharacterized protein [Amphiura filiformis]|uniref:uncharacterized protein n=1 Tax=Amphiura filiformis TaxID=82378 RepID=UPI003B21D346
MMAQVSSENFNRCLTALQVLLSKTLPRLQHAIDTWHHQTTHNIPPCVTPNLCPQKKKPSTKNKACQGCIDWVAAIEAEVHPPTIVGSLQWTNANPTLFSKDPLEVIKLFVLRQQGHQSYSQLADFDHASLLMIMGKFKPFHQGDQDVSKRVQRVAFIRNHLAHFKLDKNLQLDDQTFNVFWTDITDLVDGLQSLGRPFFTQQTADELHGQLKDIKTQPMPVKLDKGILRALIKDVVSEFKSDAVEEDSSDDQNSLHAIPGDTPHPPQGQTIIPGNKENMNDLIQSIAADLRNFYLNSYCKKQMYPWKSGNYMDLDEIYLPVTIDITIPGIRPIKKRLKSYQEIFESNDDKRYILTGSPGQGKSTFCAKLAFDWCHKTNVSPLQDVQLLFIVQLATLDHLSNIEDAICSQLLSSDIDRSIIGKIIRDLGKVVLVLDGLDEAPLDLLKHEITGNLVEIISYKQLRACHVLVTTRPWRETEIVSQCPVYRRLELQKMNRSDVKQYVRKLFGQRSDDLTTIALGRRLLQYIDENKLLLDTSTPLMVLLTSWYWVETNGERGIPDRISEVYEQIVNIMYENCMNATSNESAQSTVHFNLDF